VRSSITPDSRLPEVGVSIFAVMTQLANEHGAINLSQGFPDFDCAPELVALVREWLGRGQNQYAPMPGVLRLRRAIARLRPRHRDHGDGRGHRSALLDHRRVRAPG
jgi:aspartate/methionine/tyrosine aminotransferase